VQALPGDDAGLSAAVARSQPVSDKVATVVVIQASVMSSAFINGIRSSGLRLSLANTHRGAPDRSWVDVDVTMHHRLESGAGWLRRLVLLMV